MNNIDLHTARQTRIAKILGSEVNMVDLEYTVDWLQACIAEPKSEGARQLIVTGFHGLNQASRDPRYFRIGAECDLWVPDSIAPVIIARYRGMQNVVRTPGAEIMSAFFKRADTENLRSYFYGDTEATLAALQDNLERKYPGHQIVGTFSPPFRALSVEEEQAHIDMINAAAPDVLWVGLGLPKQDEWIYRCKDRLQVPVAAGVGAAFGFLAGTVQRAPSWLCRLGLEWAYMVLRKPKRTGKRVVVDGGEFLANLFLEEMHRLRKGAL
ncbi:WecB/TagA/CpsF family glycosyltransferase [Desulfobulbus rhabdoformis]|uniref:WecB/TagA/CpsF family glycosyltransferase n=1 Tax=Desulfobulbus rhabdoformis TaxID=34032 RepID=UPI0019660D04|nr:WecB/TagA/CpsF family glycosyltransferase [Desulfobulbus rhabdoformis]MBM9612693.1 WecB/TagA/CpsF family glycosyltransferase [Desulfobulbus rhabdoformis]